MNSMWFNWRAWTGVGISVVSPGYRTPWVPCEFGRLQGEGRMQEKAGSAFPRTSCQPNACSRMKWCWQEAGTVCICMKWGFQGFKVSTDLGWTAPCPSWIWEIQWEGSRTAGGVEKSESVVLRLLLMDKLLLPMYSLINYYYCYYYSDDL